MSDKKMIKKMLIISLSATMVFATGSSVYAETLALPNGTIISQDGAKYLTDSAGNKNSGWFIDSKENWYYFNESNKTMKTGWHHDDKDGYWYYLNLSEGKMVTGWQTIEGKEYFFQPVRDMGNYHFSNEQEKWLYSVNSKVPYGALYVNTTTPDGSKVDSTGVKVVVETPTQTVNNNSSSDTDTVKNGWVSENGSWNYYENGTLAKNKWLNLDGKWYYVLSDGAMVSNSWKEISGKDYYFGSDGAMYVNTITPDGQKVGVDGMKVTSINYSDFIGYYSVSGLNQPTSHAQNITISKIENGIIYGYFSHYSDGGYEDGDFSSGIALKENKFDITVNWENRVSALDENDDINGNYQLHAELLYDSGKACVYIQSNDGPRSYYTDKPRTYNEKLYIYPEF